jgi:4a-hydroxytetrahydrobiopterin dehydratase
MSELAQRKCVPCEGGVEPLSRSQAESYLAQLEEWMLDTAAKQISKTYKFKDFMQVIDFINRIAQVAEEEGHHPDICFGWGRAEVKFTTHAIKGLSVNDFIMAAKVEEVYRAIS